MKKRGFTLIEVVVSFAIFLAAFIPIMNLTRNTTRLLNRDPSQIIKESTESSGTEANEYEGHILSEFIKQIERRGYEEIEKKIPTSGIYEATYTLTKVLSTSDSSKCSIGQYHLTPLDDFSKDPYDENRSKCYTQDSTVGDFNGQKITIQAQRGTINNVKNLGGSNQFIYVVAKLLGEEKDTVLTKLQEFLK